MMETGRSKLTKGLVRQGLTRKTVGAVDASGMGKAGWMGETPTPPCPCALEVETRGITLVWNNTAFREGAGRKAAPRLKVV